MAINQYWVGQIPSEPLAITVYDSSGRAKNLSAYSDFRVRMLGSDNEEVNLNGSVLITAGANNGRFVFRWPTDRSLFDKPGEYLLQLEILGASGTRDFTTTHTLRVRRLGGVY